MNLTFKKQVSKSTIYRNTNKNTRREQYLQYLSLVLVVTLQTASFISLTEPFCLLNHQETEKIIAELNETWEEKLRRTEAIRMERQDTSCFLITVKKKKKKSCCRCFPVADISSHPQRGPAGGNGRGHARRRRDGGRVFSQEGMKTPDVSQKSPLICVFVPLNIDDRVCRFVPKPSDRTRKPQPVFIDTVGLFSPNEVCSCEVSEVPSFSDSSHF